MQLTIHQVDAFTREPLTGNPAAVVPQGSEQLSEAQMQRIATEMNLSETAFVLPPTDPTLADLRLRWFTPACEVPLCGHATIATFHTLAALDLLTVGAGIDLRLETLSGVLPIRVEPSSDGVTVRMGLPTPTFSERNDLREPLAAAFGVELDPSQPVEVTDRGYVFAPVADLATLHRMTPDMTALVAIDRAHGLWGFTPYTTHSTDPAAHGQSRFFAPGHGVDEDPVTGSSSGPLGVLLHRHGHAPTPVEGVVMLTVEQGQAIGRPGRMDVRFTVGPAGEIGALSILGRAVTVLTGTLHLPTESRL